MNKKIYVIILIALLIAATYFFFRDSGSTLNTEFSDFSIEDTSTVNRIFISDFEGYNADLTRQSNNSWKINGSYLARRDAIDLLLLTFRNLKVRENIPASSLENTIKHLATQAIKVEIYTGGSLPEKTYYVGHGTPSNYGTYMLLEKDGVKSSIPFIMEIPGFNGYLTTRFFTEEDLWRDQTIFNYEHDEISMIELNYTETPEKSFRLELKDNGFELSDLHNNSVTTSINGEALTEYLNRFKKINFEFLERTLSKEKIDSVLESKPLHIIRLRDSDGNERELKSFYRMVKGSPINEATGEPYGYDLDRCYAYLDGKEFITIQWPMLEKILAWHDDFAGAENVDN